MQGISFKLNTLDVRETPAADIILGLGEASATVKVYDPVSEESVGRAYVPDIENYSDI